MGKPILIASLLLFALLSACNARELVPHELTITYHDFPAGWNHDKGVIELKEPGAIAARGDNFHFGKQVASQELAVYPDNASAKTNFEIWESKWFPAAGDWRRPDTATFVPANPDDSYRLGCLHFPDSNTTSCRSLQQHGPYLSLILVNLDPQAMTLEQLEYALRRLDQRFQDWDTRPTGTP
jgi:hypothetical protein